MSARATPESAPVGTRREEAKQQTRRRLIEAARLAFIEQGLDVPSLDAICERAGFTRGAFYVHFRSREELVEAVVDHSLHQFVDALLEDSDRAGGLAGTIGRFADIAAAVWNDPDGPPPPIRFRFDTLLDAAQRNPHIAATLRQTLVAAAGRLEKSVEVAERSGRAARTGAREIANLLLLVAMGVLTAADLGLPMDVARIRDAVLTLLGPSEESASDAG